jgi:secreted Zn-dependent insulinase-like peptidase
MSKTYLYRKRRRQDTCFFFSCGTSALRGALERFGAFFRAPLFTESATEREAT